MITNAPEDVDR